MSTLDLKAAMESTRHGASLSVLDNLVAEERHIQAWLPAILDGVMDEMRHPDTTRAHAARLGVPVTRAFEALRLLRKYGWIEPVIGTHNPIVWQLRQVDAAAALARHQEGT